jgi:hypothetical protein
MQLLKIETTAHGCVGMAHIGSNHIEGNSVRVLISKVLELKKLHEKKLQFKVKLRTQQWNKFLWSQ